VGGGGCRGGRVRAAVEIIYITALEYRELGHLDPSSVAWKFMD
jgi:hypothetical protein